MLREQLTWYVLWRSNFESFLSGNAQLGFGDPNQVDTTVNNFFTDEKRW